MPSNLDRALRGLSARSVLRDLMAVKSEYPSEFATRLIKDTCVKEREISKAEDSVTSEDRLLLYVIISHRSESLLKLQSHVCWIFVLCTMGAFHS